jgi:orotidine-5'-phosphate decarboxylase
VVGATHPAELAAVRQVLRDVVFLVPGYGTQGGTAADTAAAFRADGSGAVVNNARGILFPYHPDDPAWESRVEAAARTTIGELRQATPMGRLGPAPVMQF